jgi:hypothetical protein
LAAGVDTLVPVLQQLGDEAQAVPLTNAKGAFSRSLAEYAVAAVMHFNKQITRLQVGSIFQNLSFQDSIIFQDSLFVGLQPRIGASGCSSQMMVDL